MLTAHSTISNARLILANAIKSATIYENDGTSQMSAPDQKFEAKLLNSKIDWSQCQSVVRTQGVLSGRWRVKGTRIPVDAIIQNYNSGYSPEALATEIFVGLPVDLARDIVSYAAQKS